MVDEFPYQLPLHMVGSNIQHMTNPQIDLRKQEYKFKGKMENSDGDIVDYGKPLMNEEGINNTIGLLQSTVNQINIMGNLEKREIEQLMNYFSDGIIPDLMMGRKKYNMTYEGRHIVNTSSTLLVFHTMKRSHHGGDRAFWKGSVQEVNMKSETTSKGGSGILSKLNPWNKS